MSHQFKFMTLPYHSGEIANVFIHGYSAGHDMEDRCVLRKHIPSSLHGCINIFAFWPSGHWTQFDKLSSVSFSAIARLNIVAGAAAVAVDRAVHFNTSRNRATAMGKTLFSQLEIYLLKHHPYVSKVNLVGHSLGGRVVVSALRDLLDKPTNHDLEIGDVLLMATAAELSGNDARAIRKRTNCKLYLVNLARGSGLKYLQILLMLAEHYDLESKLHDCARVIEMEELLISKCFHSSFGEDHVLGSKQGIAQHLNSMSAKGYFEQVDALAASLTVTSYFSTPEAHAPQHRETAQVLTSGNMEVVLKSASVLPSLTNLLSTERIKAVVTNLKSAVKPGYSALIPAVAILYYARLKLNNEGLL